MVQRQQRLHDGVTKQFFNQHSSSHSNLKLKGTLNHQSLLLHAIWRHVRFELLSAPVRDLHAESTKNSKLHRPSTFASVFFIFNQSKLGLPSSLKFDQFVCHLPKAKFIKISSRLFYIKSTDSLPTYILGIFQLSHILPSASFTTGSSSPYQVINPHATPISLRLPFHHSLFKLTSPEYPN